MKSFVFLLALTAGQMITMQTKEVVHLKTGYNGIEKEFGGKLLELINAPPVINLPNVAPKSDDLGNQWSIDIKNMGPNRSTVAGPGRFNAPINVGQTIHIYSNGSLYKLRR